MFNLTEFSLRNNRTTLVVYLILMFVGLSSYLNIGRLEYPEFTIRSAQIITEYPGRNSVEVEQQVTDWIEQALRQMPEIDEIKSTSKAGLSIVSVELKDTYFDLQPIWQDLRNRVSEVSLPDGAGKPRVNDDISDLYPYVYALRGDGFSDRELLDFAEAIQDELLALDGVGKVEFHGVQDERVYLEFSASELAAKGISTSELIDRLRGQNAVASSGRANVGTERLSIITLGEFESIEELANYQVTIPGQSTSLRISDLVQVKRGYVEPARSRVHFNGERVLCIAISMIQGRAVTEVGERIAEKLTTIQARLPVGIELETMFFQPTYVSKSISDFIVNLGQAFSFVVLVMFLFAGFRLALIVGLLVPSATLLTFTCMPFFGVQLEMMSIAALIIALGLLVDNAVVVSEQILVRLSAGQERRAAVIEACKGLLIPLLAASATTIAAFSPIALAGGGTSEFTYSLYVVVSLALLSSWLLSLTIVPLFCFYFLKPLQKDTFVGRGLAVCYDPYERLLRFVLKMRWGYPILVILLTVAAVYCFKFVPNIFFPPNDRGQFIVNLELPLGTDIAETERQVGQLEEWLLTERQDEVKSVSAWIGNGGPRWYLSLAPEPANPNYSLLSVLTHSEEKADVQALMAAVREYGRAHLPGVRITVLSLEVGPPVGDPIQIRLLGKDADTLYALRDRMTQAINQVEGVSGVRDDWGAWTKQLTVNPDPISAARLGLNTQSLAQELNLQFTGTQATIYREGDRAIPVVLRSQEDYREHPDRLEDLSIFSSSLGAVPLGQVADVSIEFQPGSILRRNTLRVMTLKGQVTGRYASDVLAEIRPLLEELKASDEWPDGYYFEYGGEQEESSESQSSLGAAMPISMAILGFILIAQFNSIRRFFIIMCTIPSMLIGVVPGLLITGSSFGFMTLLGLIALLGIIVNNAILLIDEINLKLADKLELVEAIIAACRSRLRPIILTTCTTIIGLLPLALAGGDMWSSMAFAMMFGLAFGTALTLLLCPVLFYLFFKKTYAQINT